jgi:hypothetical protein
MFINETTIVLVFMPVVLGVCKERSLSPSRYLLCAVYGAALGGQLFKRPLRFCFFRLFCVQNQFYR